MRGVTSKQAKVLRFIGDQIEAAQRPPTLREIGEHIGVGSTNAVSDYIRALERKGMISRTVGASRGVALTREGKVEAGLVGVKNETVENAAPKPNSSDRFEAIASLYYRSTGHVRPGTDSPAAMGGDTGSPENVARYENWVATRAFTEAIDWIVQLEKRIEAMNAERDE